MAKIKNTTAYPTVIPQVNDLIIGTDVGDNNKTVTFTIGSVGGAAAINQDLNSVLGVGNTSLLNIELNGNASALGSSITVIDVFPTTISAGGLGSHGVNGQVLSSTGTGLAWINSPGLNQSWDDTLNVSAVATANPSLTGVFTIQTAGGFNVLGTSTSNFRGPSRFYNTVTIDDGIPVDFSSTSKILINSAAGSVGQFLSATATGMSWTSNGTINVPTLQEVVTSGNTLLNSSILFTGTGGISLSAANTITGTGNITLTGNGDITVPATRGIISVGGSLNLPGDYTPIYLGTSSGTSGQALVSNGPFITPTWQTVAGSNQNLQQVLDVGNAATQTINLTGAVNLLGTTGELNLGATSFITLNTNRGLAGQVLVSGGAVGFPTWASAGTGTITAVNVTDTTYLDMSVDVSTPSTPSLSTALITKGQIATGPGGLTQAFYVNDVTGTNYSVGSALSTVATIGTGSGIVVNIISTAAGSINLSNLSFVAGGSGYVAGDKIQITQAGSNNNCVIELDSIATGTFYDQTGKFSVPPGEDWDLAVTAVGTVLTVANSDGSRSSSFTLTGTGGAVFTNTGNNIELGFTGSGTGTVQNISLTDSVATVGTAITSSGSFTFSEQVATATLLRTTSAVSGLGITLSTEIPTIQAVATVGGVLLNTALTIQNGNGTTNNSFVLGTTAVPSVATAGQVLAYNSTSGGYMEWVNQTGGGSMSSWTITGDSGSSSISNGETVNIAGGVGVTTTLNGATRVLTIDNSGVTKIIAGPNISISPVGGTGDVTIESTAPGTGTVTSVGIIADNGAGTGITTLGSFTFEGGTNVTTSVTGNIVTIDAAAAAGVSSFTASSGTFINLTPTTTQTGVASLTGDFSATGTPGVTNFLRGDNAWVVPPDTTYSIFTGATSAPTDGTSGLVPQPLATTLDYNKFLKGDGTWATPAGAGTLTAITATLPITVDLASDPAIPALDINNFQGATGSVNGLKGTVPPPLIANELQFLQGTGNWVTPPTYVGAVSTVSAGVVGYVPSATNLQNLHFLRGDGTWVIPTDTNTTYSADSTTLTLSGTQFSISAGSASNLALGVSTTQLAGAPGTGTVNQVLESDGLGGFAWGTGAPSGVTTINSIAGAITIEGTGDIATGYNAAKTVSVTTAGTGYVLNRIYATEVLSSITPGDGLSVKVTQVGGSGQIQAVSLYGRGENWTTNDTISVLNTGKEGVTAVLEITSVEPITNVGVSAWSGVLGTASLIQQSGSPALDFAAKSVIPAFQESNTLNDSTLTIFRKTTTVNSVFQNTTWLNGTQGDAGKTNPQRGFGLDVGNQDIGISCGTNKNIRIGYYGTPQGQGSTATLAAVTALGNVSIGTESGCRLTTGQFNTSTGYNSGMDNTEGDLNTSIGPEAYSYNVNNINKAKTGDKNVFVGYRSGAQAIASEDIGIGSYAGSAFNNLTNDQNAPADYHRIAIGYAAMGGGLGDISQSYYRHQYGKDVVAIGSYAAVQSTTTDTTARGAQVYIGYEAGKGSNNIQSSDDNSYQVAIGHRALFSTLGREGHIAIGREAGVNSATGNFTYGISIGYRSGGYTGTASGLGVINIGYQSTSTNTAGGTIGIGTRSINTGTNTIAIGVDSYAGNALGTVSDSIAIGSEAENKFAGGVALGAGAATDDANQFAVGSSSSPVGTLTVQTPATTNATWTVKINGTDYNIPIYAV